ncbi:MAG: hypothetical protein K0B10_04635 [Vicingaceae bacterium]|nr:hypothetical protein [Vicingaceae bacterium]
MSKSDFVFELVKSLTKNEKRFFKIFSKRHGEKNDLKYLQLYDIYDSLVNFNQDTFRKLLHEKDLTQNLRNLKHQLHFQVLRSLNAYHYKKSVENEVTNYIQNAQILFDKGLLIQAQKTIEQAKTLAKKYDLQLYLLECLKKEQLVVRELYDRGKLEYFATTGLDEEKKILDEYLLFSQTNQLRNQLILVSRESYNFSEEEVTDKLNHFKQTILNLSNNKSASFHNHELILTTKAYFYFFSEDYKIATKTQEEWLELYQDNPEQLEINLLSFISNTYNSLVAHFIQKQHSKVEERLKLLDFYRFSSTNRLIKLKLFTYLNIGLAFYNQKGDFEKSSSYEDNIFEGLVKYDTAIHIFAKVSLYLHLIVSFIGLNQFEKANLWTNKALNELQFKSISIQLFIVKILSLIIAFEQKKFIYLNFIAKQYFNDIDDVKSSLTSLKLLICFFYTNKFNELTKAETNEMLERLKLDLNDLFNDSNEKLILDVFDVLSWIDSHLYNQSYLYLVQLKFSSKD